MKKILHGSKNGFDEQDDEGERHYDASGDEIMTTALLDRLTHKAHILECVGESYRFRQRMRMEEQAATSQPG